MSPGSQLSHTPGGSAHHQHYQAPPWERNQNNRVTAAGKTRDPAAPIVPENQPNSLQRQTSGSESDSSCKLHSTEDPKPQPPATLFLKSSSALRQMLAMGRTVGL